MTQARWIHWANRAATIVLVVVAIAVVFLVWNVSATNHTIAKDARNGYIIGCKHTNAVGHGLLDSTITRSEKSLTGTLASPFSTAQQKAIARANLASLLAYQKQQRAVLSDANCVYPPVAVLAPSSTSTTTVRPG